MPTLAHVDGAQIVFYANEHPPPHFHVRWGEHQAVIDIETLTVTEGFLPVRIRRRILEWARSRKAQLHSAFLLTTSHQKVGIIS